MNSSVSPSCDFRNITNASALPGYIGPTSTVGNLKIVRFGRSYYCCYIHMPTFRIVLLLRNFSLGGKLCLRDEKILRLYSSPPLAIAGERRKRHTTRACA